MKKLILILLCVTSAICFAQPEQYGPYDPGAMRTGQVAKAATGTAAAPAYTFSSDPDTGIYSAGADTIGFGAGGSQAATLSSTDFATKNLRATTVKSFRKDFGSFGEFYHNTGTADATQTIALFDIDSNQDQVAIYLSITGSTAGNGFGYAQWHALIGAYNNSGTLVFTSATTTATSLLTVGSAIGAPIITASADGTKVKLEIYMPNAYARYAIKVSSAGYLASIE